MSVVRVGYLVRGLHARQVLLRKWIPRSDPVPNVAYRHLGGTFNAVYCDGHAESKTDTMQSTGTPRSSHFNSPWIVQ